MKKIFLTGVCIMVAIVVLANQRSVTLENEGTLTEQFTNSERTSIDSLTLSGKVNYADLKYIRTMSALRYLDLSDVSLVTSSPGGSISTYSSYLISGNYEEGIDVYWRLSDQAYSTVRDKRGGFIFTVYTNDLTGLLIGTGITEYTPPRSVCKITTDRPEVKSVDEDYDYQIWDNYYHFLPLQSETLETVHIPAECTLISGAVFANTPNLKEIDVEASNNIYDSRDNCNSIIETESNTLVCGISTSTIPNTITAIGSRAFEGSTIETVTVPSSVEVIGTNAFARCERLTSAAIAGTVMLGDSVFMGCTALDSISLPVELEQIGKDCFYNCKKLQAVNYEGGLSDWNLIYFDDQPSGIYRMIYSNPLVYASRYYIDNKLVNNMEIPADMDVVFNTTFYGYKGLKTLLVGSNVQSVGKNAFKYCNNLEMIYSAVENPDLVYGANVIENGAPIEVFGDLSNTTVFVPKGLKPTYEACSTFKRAKAIIETDPVADKQRYDTNRDGELNVGDVAALYNALVVSSQDESADLNGDGIINVGDISSIYNAILSGVSFWWK